MHEPGTKRHPMIDMEEFERRLRQSSGTQTEDDPLAELARLTSGQPDSFQRVAEPQGQSSTEARQVATLSSEVQETEAQEPDDLQSLDDDNTACQDPGTVNEEIVSRRSLYIMIVAAIIIVGIVGIGASSENEVTYHLTVNGALEKTLIPSAQNAELKSLLQTGLKLFKEHEKHAENLVSELK